MEDLRLAYNTLLKPGKSTKKSMTSSAALKLYYKLTLLPFILFVVVGYLTSSAGTDWSSNFMMFSAVLSSIMPAYSALIVNAIMFFWILIPAGLLIDAFLYQVIGKFFLNVWKGNYSKTLTACVFGSLPLMLFYWIVPVQVIGKIALLVFGAWNFVVLIIAMSNQQNTTRMNALVSIAATGLFVILVLFASLAFSALGYMTLPVGMHYRV